MSLGQRALFARRPIAPTVTTPPNCAETPNLLSPSLGELRTKLTGLSLPTTGLRAELEARYDYAMRLERAKTQQWDPAAQAWVPMPMQ